MPVIITYLDAICEPTHTFSSDGCFVVERIGVP